MTTASLFPFAETWWVYGVFVLFVVGMLALDFGVFHRRAHAVGFREAAAWSVVWGLVAFGVGTALFSFLAGAVGRSHLLRYGLGLVLVFVGLKMAWRNDALGGKLPIAWSLGVISLLLAATVGLSLAFPKLRAPRA